MVLKTGFFALFFYLLLAGMRRPLAIDKLVQGLFNKLQKNNYLHKLDVLVKSSAVDKYIPFFNLYFLLTITIIIILVTGVFSYNQTESIVASGGIAVLFGIIPILLLRLMTIINIRRVRNNYHGFLCSLIGFFSLSGDVVGSYMNAADYTGQPLKSYVKDAVYKYSKSNAKFEACLEELSERASEREFTKLVKFTKLYLSYGGDFSAMLNKLNTQSFRLENARVNFYSSAYVGIAAIILMIFIDVGSIFMVFTNQNSTGYVLNSTLMGTGLLLGNLAAISFGIYTAFMLFRGDI